MFKPLQQLVVALACASALSASAQTPSIAGAELRAQRVAASLAQELAAQCPLASPGSQAAFDACRQGLFQAGSQLRQNLPDFVLWGRQRDPKLSLKNTNLTQFGPDVLSGMYLSLFMFDGQHTVNYVESEGLYQIRLKTAFRNRLAPGQFPYPFWHEEEKWSMYQQANEILFWWDEKNERIKVAQFTVHGANPPLLAVEQVKAYAFDGKWLWTDDQGKTQPKVTVFDGLFKPDNPYLTPLDGAYKNLALRLREGQCNECHVPNNPDKSKRLVLLQTPAHAGAEIKRLIKSVQDDRMPRDEAGIEQPLPQHTKAALLRDSQTFDQLYDAAKQWEAGRGARTNMMAGKRGEAGGR